MKPVKIVERRDVFIHLAAKGDWMDLPDSTFHIVVSDLAYAAIRERGVLQRLLVGFQHGLNKYIEELEDSR